MNGKNGIGLLLAGLLATCTALAGDGLVIERLTWAGIRMTAADTTVFIDAIGTDIWDGKAPGGLVPVEATTPRRYALVTHAHNDHLDVTTLKAVLGERGYVIVHESIATHIASRGLQVIVFALLVGFALTRAGDAGERIADWFRDM